MRLAISFLTKPGFYFSGAKCGWARCGGERSPSTLEPLFCWEVLYITIITARDSKARERRWERRWEKLEGKTFWVMMTFSELEKSPHTISTSTKRHEPPTAAPLTTLHCPGGGDATRGGCAGNDEDEGSGGVRACACAACAACACPSTCTCAACAACAFVCPCSCTCAACAACACASTRAAFLVPPNSWQPRDTTTVCVLVRVRRT